MNVLLKKKKTESSTWDLISSTNSETGERSKEKICDRRYVHIYDNVWKS